MVLPVFNNPLDTETILADKDLAEAPLVRLSKAFSIFILSYILVRSVKVPKSKVAESGPHDIVDFREHFKLFG